MTTEFRLEGRSGRAGTAVLEGSVEGSGFEEVMVVDATGVLVPEGARPDVSEGFQQVRKWQMNLLNQRAPRAWAAKRSSCYLGMLLSSLPGGRGEINGDGEGLPRTRVR